MKIYISFKRLNKKKFLWFLLHPLCYTKQEQYKNILRFWEWRPSKPWISENITASNERMFRIITNDISSVHTRIKNHPDKCNIPFNLSQDE